MSISRVLFLHKREIQWACLQSFLCSMDSSVKLLSHCFLICHACWFIKNCTVHDKAWENYIHLAEPHLSYSVKFEAVCYLYFTCSYLYSLCALEWGEWKSQCSTGKTQKIIKPCKSSWLTWQLSRKPWLTSSTRKESIKG